MQLSFSGREEQTSSRVSLTPAAVHTWLIRWDRRESIHIEFRIFVPQIGEDIDHALHVWCDAGLLDRPHLVPVSSLVPNSGFALPSLLLVEHTSILYRAILVDLETPDFETRGGFFCGYRISC